MFLDKVYSVHLHILIKHECLKNLLQTKETLQKMHSFLFRELQLITGLIKTQGLLL